MVNFSLYIFQPILSGFETDIIEPPISVSLHGSAMKQSDYMGLTWADKPIKACLRNRFWGAL